MWKSCMQFGQIWVGTFEFAVSFVDKNAANGHLPDCAVRLFGLPTNQMSDAEFDEHVEKSDFGLGPAEARPKELRAGKSLEQACRHLGGVLRLLAAKGTLEF